MRRLIDLGPAGGTDGLRLAHKLCSIVGGDHMELAKGVATGGMCFWIDTSMSNDEIIRRWPKGGLWRTPVITRVN